MLGDATLFARRDEIETAWAWHDPLLKKWESEGEPDPYPAGTWGPEAADALIEKDGRKYIVGYHPASRFYREDLGVKVKEDFALLREEVQKL